jgi:hypothetical protein
MSKDDMIESLRKTSSQERQDEVRRQREEAVREQMRRTAEEKKAAKGREWTREETQRMAMEGFKRHFGSIQADPAPEEPVVAPLTLDQFIADLLNIRAEHGGDLPVLMVDCLPVVHPRVSEDKDCVWISDVE